MTSSSRTLPWSVALCLTINCSIAATSGAQQAPSQFIAKTYTEALGRAPDQGGWASAVTIFQNTSCTQATLKQWGRVRYLSHEYNLAYGNDSGAPCLDHPPGDPPHGLPDNAARVITVYRGIVNREPDASGFTNFYNRLQNHTLSFPDFVDLFYDSGEFAALVPLICNQESYGFGTQRALTNPTVPAGSGGFPGGTSFTFQGYMDSVKASGATTVYLAPRAVVAVTQTIVVPAGITVKTIGDPTPNRYASMGRFVRARGSDGTPPFTSELLRLHSGAALRHVWVDGQRGANWGTTIKYCKDAINVYMYAGGTNTYVTHCVISNSSGYTNVRSEGPCANNAIHSNLITAYSSCHFRGPSGLQQDIRWTDGISAACEDVKIEYNEIVDVSDVGIVIFRTTNGNPQRSRVRGNKILNAGNSAWAAIGADPLFSATGSGSHSFVGASVTENVIWSGRGHFDVGLMVGTMITPFSQPNDMGFGASFTNNSVGTATATAKVDVGIGVSGMLQATVTGNSLNVTLVNTNDNGRLCPVPGCNPNPPATSAVAASICDGLASGTIQASEDYKLQTCLGPHLAYCPTPPVGACTSSPAPPPGMANSEVAPEEPAFRLVSNPTRSAEFAVELTLTNGAPARLTVMDLFGRRLMEREVGRLGAGRHVIGLATGSPLAPGMYLVRLLREGRSIVQRAVVIE